MATLGWQRAPSGVMLYTESKEILCLPNKNRIQTPNRICFFCGLLVFCFFVVVFLFIFLLAKVRGNQQAAKRGKLWLEELALPPAGHRDHILNTNRTGLPGSGAEDRDRKI